MQEPHPIPQNVTSFQFHLVGDMTLKQFGYLAVGVGIAYVTFVFFIASSPFIAWPIVIISSLLGTAFAFLPIADRPLDYWLVAYLKAVYSPTKRSWNKNGKTYLQESTFQNRLNIFLPPVQSAPPPIHQPFVSPAMPSKPVNLPTPEELKSSVDLAKQAQDLQSKIVDEERKLNQLTTTDEINSILQNLQKLVSDASQIKNQLSINTGTPPAPIEKAKVKIVAPIRAKQTQIILTSLPNVINGIITDSTNNYLEGVVVVIYDKAGLPVRALKTNKLGQFSGSTPLPNGSYTIELEKDNLLFDVLQIDLEGKVLPAVAISAKKVI